MSKYDEWAKRHKGFDDYAGSVISEIKKSLPTETKDSAESTVSPRPDDDAKSVTSEVDKLPIAVAEDLYEITTSLREFTKRLFTFFLDGFSDFFGEESKKIILIPSAEYSPEYVLQRILQQASFDLTVIERISEQRRNEKLSSFLEKYDQLALSALSVAFPDPDKEQTWLIDPVRPFIYFQRETTVRIVPYANIVLIGVPYSARFQPIDLLSIPHEVGHHIYLTGRFSKTNPIGLFYKKFFADQEHWIQNWLEETFADLFGFLVAGPISACSLKEIMLDNSLERLVEDDGDHPVGIIRPLVFSELFKSNDFNNGRLEAKKTAEELDKRWRTEGRKRGFANQFRTATESELIKRDKASENLSLLMKQMYETMKDNTIDGAFTFPASLDVRNNLQPWTLFPNQVSAVPEAIQINLDDPFANFVVDDVLKLQKTQIEKMKKILGDPKFMLSRKDKNKYWLTGQIKYWEDQSDARNLQPLVPDIWKLIFTAFSWADKPSDTTRPVTGPEQIDPESIRW